MARTLGEKSETSPPLISIVINSYNYGHLLPRLLSSISGQSFSDYEVVMVNDCSTDETDEVVEDFITNNPDIEFTYIRNEKRKGIGAGQTSGIYASSGEYLMFADADDWLDDDCLQVLASRAKETGADRIIGSFRYVDESGKVLKKQTINGNNMDRWLFTMQQANLFRRSIFIDNGIIISNTRFQDNESVFKFDMYCKSVSYVQEIAYNYLVHTSDSRDNQMIFKKMMEKDTFWETRPLFKLYREEIYDRLSGDDRLFFEYSVLRFYYSLILQRVQGLKREQAYGVYEQIRCDMLSYFPNYLQNSLVRKRPVGNSVIRKMVAPVCCTMEKVGIMKPMLRLYAWWTRSHMIVN